MKKQTHIQSKTPLGVLTLCSLLFSGMIAICALAEGEGGRGDDDDSSDETIGGWPLNYGGPSSGGAGQGGSADERVAPTPVLHIVGPTNVVFDAVMAVNGIGDAMATNVAPGVLRVDFVGNLHIALDEAVLANHSELQLGVDALFPHDLKVSITWDDGQTPIHTIGSGNTFDLSYARLASSGVLEQPIQVNTSMGASHNQIGVDSGAGIITLSTH
jgi:hypothetical protein